VEFGLGVRSGIRDEINNKSFHKIPNRIDWRRMTCLEKRKKKKQNIINKKDPGKFSN
jgi:hypothetical protein